MKNKIIIFLILSICIINKTFSQIYSDNQQGLKRSSLFKIEKIEYEKDTFILGGVALHPSQTSVYAMAGIVKKYGLYLKLKTNLNFNGSYVKQGGNYNAASSQYFDGNIYKGRFAATGGLLWRIAKPLIFYGGLGYGNRWVNWETLSGKRFRVTDISYDGLDVETGLMYKYKKFFFTGGISTISFQYMELNIGVGYKLNLKNKINIK